MTTLSSPHSAPHSTEIAVVGAGIVGLAHALAAARRGHRVTVFERSERAVGASIRNFGMVWPIGQPPGPLRDRAMLSRQIWMDMATKGDFFYDPVGSLHLAYHPDELAVMEEFVALAQPTGYAVQMLTAEEAAAKSQAAVTTGLLGALWSETEVIVDAREAIATLPQVLQATFNVEFRFGATVTAIDSPQFTVNGETWTADHIFVCSGADFETLYPDLYQNSGITKSKLQMMRTSPQPQGYRIGPALCGGLTLTHYAAFADCPSLPVLKQRIQAELSFAVDWHIHVMMSQNGLGELILGDSHEYALTFDPFDRTDINQFVLNYLRGFAQVPCLDIAATWHGIYAKLPGKTEFVAHPAPGVTLVNGLSGAGMTLSFGLAEEVMTTVLHR
ncbi:TIGR03364 family FAD-dependent oxidoreductase [Phormidium sp. FACHB-1136]|uniref:TIGR03364 family FAD-dependent oxidoreductase n=1 Tax=Phormidium sp. FACHB-1136 TaxID=2692848 RepID=UPI001686E213|nr:TIGR03364 family FAD-dependent oxidoreductase [Phormidium sp. FACHB-1136]MBD2427592.1 TIGR03364 family FAD-dependent oxidoreductase [Phormidium sp. FACHB-1136]